MTYTNEPCRRQCISHTIVITMIFVFSGDEKSHHRTAITAVYTSRIYSPTPPTCLMAADNITCHDFRREPPERHRIVGVIILKCNYSSSYSL